VYPLDGVAIRRMAEATHFQKKIEIKIQVKTKINKKNKMNSNANANANANANTCACNIDTDIRGRCSPKDTTFKYCTTQVDTVYWYLINDVHDTGMYLDECETLEEGLDLIEAFASERKWKLTKNNIQLVQDLYTQDWNDNHTTYETDEEGFDEYCDCCAKLWTDCQCLCGNCCDDYSICKYTCKTC
jgi:hypothetical protein